MSAQPPAYAPYPGQYQQPYPGQYQQQAYIVQPQPYIVQRTVVVEERRTPEEDLCCGESYWAVEGNAVLNESLLFVVHLPIDLSVFNLKRMNSLKFLMLHECGCAFGYSVLLCSVLLTLHECGVLSTLLCLFDLVSFPGWILGSVLPSSSKLDLDIHSFRSRLSSRSNRR